MGCCYSYCRILCFAGAIQSISQFGGVIFSSIGKPEVEMYVSVGRTILTILAIVFGVQYGVLWVAYFLVISKAISFMLFLIVLNRYIPFSIIQLYNSLKGPMISFTSLSFIYLLFNLGYITTNPCSLLATMVVIGLIILYIFHKKTIEEVLKVLKEQI